VGKISDRALQTAVKIPTVYSSGLISKVSRVQYNISVPYNPKGEMPVLALLDYVNHTDQRFVYGFANHSFQDELPAHHLVHLTLLTDCSEHRYRHQSIADTNGSIMLFFVSQMQSERLPLSAISITELDPICHVG
jgi:hypothetical protein